MVGEEEGEEDERSSEFIQCFWLCFFILARQTMRNLFINLADSEYATFTNMLMKQKQSHVYRRCSWIVDEIKSWFCITALKTLFAKREEEAAKVWKEPLCREESCPLSLATDENDFIIDEADVIFFSRR